MISDSVSSPLTSATAPSVSSLPPLHVVPTEPNSRIDSTWFRWGPAAVGGAVATALSLVLTGFGRTLGFADLAQTWRNVTPALSLMAGVWFLVVALASAAAGGYLAGRARDRWALQQTDETEFRDGTHGLVAWALAVILGALIASSVANAAKSREPVDPAIPISSQALGAPASILTQQTDRMLRSDRRPGGADPTLRNEAGRLLTSATTARKVNAVDRSQLTRVVAAATGLTGPAAQKRVDDNVAAARQKLASAHHAEAIGAFVTAASLLLAALAAWFAAEAGGRHREGTQAPSLLWSPRRLRVIVRERR